MTHFQYDSSLIAAFLDWWRPETHSFHLPIGEMTVSLEDVSMLFGLLLEPWRASRWGLLTSPALDD
jgi:hypothetical protein